MELSVPSIATAAARGLVNNPKTTYRTCASGLPLQHQFARSRLRSLACLMMFNKQSSQRNNRRVCSLLQAVSPLQCTEIATQLSVSFEDFCISVSTEEDKVVKIQVNVAGTRTDSTFEEVFRKNVAAAQPFPGFRRLKGGKTPEIPKEVALHLIGPSKVKKETIKQIVNSTIGEYVQKEELKASRNLKVLQSFEELEAAFEPGKEFCFNAVIHLE